MPEELAIQMLFETKSWSLAHSCSAVSDPKARSADCYRHGGAKCEDLWTKRGVH